ncbi:MAG: type VI secretion system tip protein VgrG [Ilumatobacter sp.]|uniref:type VI secretion system tip protein VgrG n=1 Tax=Ilumatobacter sp. TaxID=1967498 RepID=UPI002604B310|nr:type VI secretion system tip protein VgrG [Ilumatobacter sp.]MDJ0768462.1 type VI secretion system tip protein VgrG [Ilumatobacter sp.]
MSDDQLVPTAAPADRPSFTISAGGTEIKGEYQVRSIVVERAFNRVAAAEIVVFDGDVAAREFPASDADDFVPGTEIEIAAGYHGEEDVIFKGIVVRHGLRAPAGRPSTLCIECRDAAVKLTVGRKTGYFYDETDADIIEAICSDAGLTPDVATTQVTHPSMVQYYATDWDFILTRAEANGMLVATKDGTLEVKAPDASGEAALVVGYGGNVLEFEAAADARDQLAAVQSSAWNPADQELAEVEGADPGAVTPGNLDAGDLADVVGLDAFELKHGGILADDELQGWADAQLLRSGFAKVRGRVRVQGFGAIEPGDTIELKDVGDRFTGTALVAGVRHEISSRNWETDVQFGLSPDAFGSVTRDVVDSEANGLLPGVQGVHVALVTALEGDPDGEHRIQVRIPMIDVTGEGVWARVATLDAGENRGSFFLPEIGDEVIVGFLGGDPRDPVVLGMMNSSAKPAPIEASDDNHEKGLVTRGELKVLFDDDKLVVTIETPNGNTIVLSDDDGAITVEDESGNKLTMESDGVTVTSAGDLTLQADGDVTIEGSNVTIAAQSQLAADGSSGAEFTSGGSTVVKGSVVQLN